MSCCFREGCADMVSTHFVAFDFEMEFVRPGFQNDIVFFLTQQKARRVKCHFKLGGDADETRSDKLFHSIPGKLQRQDMIVRIGLRVATTPWFNVSTIIQVALLFRHVKLNPIVKAGDLPVFDFSDEHVLEPRRILGTTTATTVQIKPNLVQQLQKGRLIGRNLGGFLFVQVLVAELHRGRLHYRLEKGPRFLAFVARDGFGLSAVGFVIVHQGHEGLVGGSLQTFLVHVGKEWIPGFVLFPVGFLSALDVHLVVDIGSETIDIQVPHLLNGITEIDIQIELRTEFELIFFGSDGLGRVVRCERIVGQSECTIRREGMRCSTALYSLRV
jgi:hypothetical protein